MRSPRSVARVALCAALATPALQSPTPLRAQLPTSTAERIRLVENGLLPGIQVRGRDYRTTSLAERMRQLQVPAVSIAVIHDGKLEWARAYGLADVASQTPATTATLFQAASMSKPVAATGALALVRDGRLTLDGDVNQWLRSWQVPRDSFTADQPVTLAHLLSHTAGLTVHGFPGYARGAPLPTVAQVLRGEPPANTAAVRVDQPPGRAWRYSGGGFTVMQQLVQDITLEPFAEFMQRTVLEPLGMAASTYQQPLPEGLQARAATGYRSDGAPVEGRFHVYPEQAAAGLWTTPTDLARWILDVQATFSGRSERVLSTWLAAQLLRSRTGSWGLGVGLRPTGQDLAFEHGGANEGFRGQFFGLASLGEGAVVMTNSDAGDRLAREIVQALARAYHWSGFSAHEIVSTPLPPDSLDAYAGDYTAAEVAGRLRIDVADGGLYGTMPGGARSELVPVGGDWFAVLASGDRVRFEREASGRVVALRVGTTRFTRADP